MSAQPPAVIENAATWVLEGVAVETGMPSFADSLTEADVTKLIAFIQGTADAVRPQAQ